MDNLFYKSDDVGWLRDRKKKLAHTEIVSLKEYSNDAQNLLIFQR